MTKLPTAAARDPEGLVKHRIVDSPLGPLTLVVADSGALTGLFMDAQRHLPEAATFGVRSEHVAQDAVAQLAEYFAGTRVRFDLDLDPRGTDFQRRVWHELTRIPHGQTATYGDLARQLGAPGASRALGAATGRNPIGIVIPCHRLVGASGSLTGYAGGLERKQWLLAHEAGANR